MTGKTPALRHRPSPNYGPRSPDAPIDILLLHYTGMKRAAAALDRLCDPAAEVSAHYLIDENGTVWQLVDEAERAWHAGAGWWHGETDINSRSIGIELANPGHEWGYRPFPPAQMQALAELAAGIMERHPIPPERVLGHSDVAPRRKIDPGELFDWRWLAERGIGVWPEPEVGEAVDPADIERLLARYGYGVPSTGCPDGDLRTATAAFQRHFRPRRVTGEADPDTCARLAGLCRRYAPG